MGILPKDIELLPPYDDRIFKVLMTSPKAEPTLLYLASAIINRPVIKVLVRNNELPISDIDEKSERFDVNCEIDHDTQADIEMQSSRMDEKPGGDHGNLKARSIYNLCDLHSSQKSKGKVYGELFRTYQVMFCGYTVFPDRKDFINPFSMRHDKDNGLLHDAIQVLFVELSKLNELVKKPVDEMTDMEKISVFLRYAENPDYRDVVNRVIETKEGLAVAGEVLMGISKDEREKAIFRNRRIALADQESNRVTREQNMVMAEKMGREEGMAEGRAEGRAEERNTIAKNLLSVGYPIEKIIMVTGLTFDEVNNLKNEK